jgi:transcriptional regulator with XRE-family HTH domain
VDKIRELRIERGLSQAKLAARAEVDPSTINQIERGARNASPLTLRKLAWALGVSLAELLQETDSPKARRRSAPEPSLFNSIEDERQLRYLRALRALVWNLEKRWEDEPPKDTSVVLDTMRALREQGVFDLAEAQGDEWGELKLLLAGLETLNDIADSVEKAEEAEKRRAEFTVLQGKMTA